ncbi:unnamed protein product [Pleuronectes platessa]|uniref:Uncharacterized protein n=1 Tax=Pleuronectes platessa TaxID=8262 RepID=A0A9N7UY62_PLEPL|nr:unnamed protein product [Pleuronectes platessa]
MRQPASDTFPQTAALTLGEGTYRRTRGKRHTRDAQIRTGSKPFSTSTGDHPEQLRGCLRAVLGEGRVEIGPERRTEVDQSRFPVSARRRTRNAVCVRDSFTCWTFFSKRRLCAEQRVYGLLRSDEHRDFQAIRAHAPITRMPSCKL